MSTYQTFFPKRIVSYKAHCISKDTGQGWHPRWCLIRLFSWEAQTTYDKKPDNNRALEIRVNNASIILCKCTVCKKTTEIVENIYGLTTIGTCTITNGCKGKLVKQTRNPTILASSGFVKVEDVSTTDYSHRRTFFQKEYALKSDAWLINHELGVEPAVYVYVNIEGELVQLSKKAYEIVPIDANTIQILFADSYSGLVQCLARSSVPYVPEALPPTDELKQVSANGVLSLRFPVT